ncbi:hypothetical protein CG51_19230 [Haematobacter missouriensis]|uniref:Uncharacterized protein n=1 Tax=Haematobacter missouriensis TaxID=366616 RepID=A0A212AJ03_9RHOB|nr:hypothetical protein [Haematobacter missouriensis]KFI33007.1 hypothetical protein CG51_19230 [Haematobacter missouriensis]OWJ74115.1 hypothetical protein CDV53_14060 [Haematobacter missouriensis]OWJ81482.1 hypothetical protein CDV52_17915 [Haematobacter missouriensis]
MQAANCVPSGHREGLHLLHPPAQRRRGRHLPPPANIAGHPWGTRLEGLRLRNGAAAACLLASRVIAEQSARVGKADACDTAAGAPAA